MELTPKTRKETFLAAAGGQDVTTPTPITREEVFLDAIAKGGGGGGGGGSSGGGVLVVTQDENGVLNKTWQEIRDAMAVGQIPVIGYVDGNDAGITIIGWGAFLDDAYSLWGYGANISQDDPWYSASSASDYPTAN